MKKIKTVFKRDLTKRPSLVINKINEGCEWVFNGEGYATRKYDGSCCKIEDGIFYKRREVKKDKPEPAGFILEQEDYITGKKVGWVIVTDTPENKWFIKAYNNTINKSDGTYEAIGKGFQGDVEKFGDTPCLFKHSDAEVYPDCPRTFDGLKKWLTDKDIEGIVFHHKDGKMAKIKKKDFGLKR